jgi:hypothetical protein
MAETVGSIMGNHVGKGRYLTEDNFSKELYLGEECVFIDFTNPNLNTTQIQYKTVQNTQSKLFVPPRVQPWAAVPARGPGKQYLRPEEERVHVQTDGWWPAGHPLLKVGGPRRGRRCGDVQEAGGRAGPHAHPAVAVPVTPLSLPSLVSIRRPPPILPPH